MNFMNAGKKALPAAAVMTLTAASPLSRSIAAQSSFADVDNILYFAKYRNINLIFKAAQTEAKAPPAIESLVEERAQRLAEQKMPRTAVPFDPKNFDTYVGLYQVDRYEYFAITREGDHFFAGPEGREDQKVEIYPESPTKFFAKTLPAQFGFMPDAQGPDAQGPDAQGKVTKAEFHVNGFEITGAKVDASVAVAAHAELAARIKNNTPSPGAEAALRRYIAAFQHGRPNYGEMIPIAAMLTYERFAEYADHFQKWGALRSLTFVEVMPNGFNKYLAAYERSRAEMIIEPLSPDGKIAGVRIGKIED